MPKKQVPTLLLPKNYFADPRLFGINPHAVMVMPPGGDAYSQLQAQGQHVLVCWLTLVHGRKLYRKLHDLDNAIVRSTFNEVRRGISWMDRRTWSAGIRALDAAR